ncbi:7-cyano-7-deazaguanine synthase [Planomonospora sphaerica]|uniref:7-cyano-7-deazaguanine synthase n=1 Tax=Planomonospora sphaerica TaxID=161355 RepID=A0A171DIQ7_9ACTN|nr:7-cyano-7-deazaguanine synthase [Planomonospora sphaerica]GAT68771.1 7-cyano-7-deazaguanine synthase [Planomonospora sphaerica]
MTTENRAVALLSGGPDSVVAAALARESGYRIYGLYINYGQRTGKRDFRQAERTAQWLGVEELRVAYCPFLGKVGGSPLTDLSLRLGDDNRSSEYVPFRNTVFCSLAVAWAEILGAQKVVIGSIGGPWITPDNKPSYFAALNALIQEGSRSEIQAWAPLGAMSKAEVVSVGTRLGVPFGLTWSCQNDEEEPCGECNNCRDRAVGFAGNNLADPLLARTPR